MKCPITRLDGSHYDAFDFRPEDVNIWEIASALSMICRFGARGPIFWDVLSHTGLCYLLAKDELAKHEVMPADLMAGILLHDASEAYLGDLPSPLKDQPELAFYRELETIVTSAICYAFGVDPASIPWDKVTRYDLQARHIEAKAMFPFTSDTAKWCPEQYSTSKQYRLLKTFPSDWVGIARDIAINNDSPFKKGLLEFPTALEPYMDRVMRDQAAERPAPKPAAAASRDEFDRVADTTVERLRV
jgi:uncharacterized protein